MTMLRLEGLQASYGAVRALHGVSIDVPKGAMVALLGSNGAGKSTTLKVISGMVRPSAGSVQLEGQPLNGKPPNEVVKMGVAHVPEGRKVFKDLMVFENLRMGAYARRDGAGIKQDMDMVLDLFPRLKDRYRQHGSSLSGGEQQMLAIGRGLMARPKLLLLDEPSLGIAPILVADIFAALRRINKEHGTTMLIVEQNAHVALKNTTFGYVLQVGKVAVSGDSGELRRNKEVVESYMGAQG
ncbi:MAG TPA: ABC transporter ATP-binding protein [Usitatibacter sp.]|nr:ABC transporter ATP-binding protein [Usitatibacter sp.]